MRKLNRQTLFLGTAVVAALAVLVLIASDHFRSSNGQEMDVEEIPFDGERAYEHLKTICDLGKRPSGSPGMAAQQKMLTEHFGPLGGKISWQDFDVRHPEDGSRVTMRNMIIEWHPERRERILLCAHYDTRPFPDEDPTNKRGRFIGANDGASGVAVLCELARHMPKFESRYGVDFVLFDGEEFLFDKVRDRDRYFLGSTEFARWYARGAPAHRYKYGVLLDMVGDADLQLYREKNSMRLAREPTLQIWQVARKLGVKEFIQRTRTEVRDDHLPLNNIAKIPTCDIIDFDYPNPRSRRQYWHTEQDIPENCSAESLAKVGWVVHEWLKQLE